MQVYDKVKKCYEDVRQKISFKPEVALVLGSGLGDFVEQMNVEATLSYQDIDGFPTSTVEGHKGQFVFGYLGKTAVVAMQGRVHYYEGYDMSDVVLPTRLMKMMGANTLFLTNACGGINASFRPGDLMMIEDQISSFVPSPLIGSNVDEWGTRFPDMSEIYDKDLQDILLQVAKQENISLKKGVYLQTSGPNYESPAEVRMYQKLGADAVGMSTTVEAIAARHMGMRICGVACITNLACGISQTPLNHKEVGEMAALAAPKFQTLLIESIQQMGE